MVARTNAVDGAMVVSRTGPRPACGLLLNPHFGMGCKEALALFRNERQEFSLPWESSNQRTSFSLSHARPRGVTASTLSKAEFTHDRFGHPSGQVFRQGRI